MGMLPGCSVEAALNVSIINRPNALSAMRWAIRIARGRRSGWAQQLGAKEIIQRSVEVNRKDWDTSRLAMTFPSVNEMAKRLRRMKKSCWRDPDMSGW